MDILPNVYQVLNDIDDDLSREKCQLMRDCEVLKSFSEPVERVARRSEKRGEQKVLKAGYEPVKLRLSINQKPVEFNGIDQLLERVVVEDGPQTITKLEQVKIEGANNEMQNGIALVNNYIQTRNNQQRKEADSTSSLSKMYEQLFEEDAWAFETNKEGENEILNQLNLHGKKSSSFPIPHRPQRDICDAKVVQKNMAQKYVQIQHRINLAIAADLPKNVPTSILPSVYRTVAPLTNFNTLNMPLLVKEQF